MKIQDFITPFLSGNKTKTIIHEIKDLTKKRKGESISTAAKIYERPIARVRQDIGKWRQAMLAAQLPINPNRLLLLNIFWDIILDPHLSAVIQSRKIKTLSKPYQVVNKDGEEDKEKTALLQNKWFRTFMDMALDAKYWGFSLIQFGDLVDNLFSDVEIVSRFNVKPEMGIVVQFPSDMKGISWNDSPYKDWTIFVGDKIDLGLLNKAAPIVIWKKNAMGAWSEYQELFGIPMRIGKTNITDELLLNNMSTMMSTIGRAAWGVFDTEDSIELIAGSTTTNADIYQKMIELLNAELSKLILGQTMTTDDGASRSQAQVHESVANEYAAADQMDLESAINDQLFPMMSALGIDFTGFTFKFDNTENRDATAQWQIDKGLLQFYNLPEDYILEKYGTPVELRPAPLTGFTASDASAKDVQNKIETLYARTAKYYEGIS